MVMVDIHIAVLDGAGVWEVTYQCQRRNLFRATVLILKARKADIFVEQQFINAKAPSGATS